MAYKEIQQGATSLLGPIEIKNIYQYLGANVSPAFRTGKLFTFRKRKIYCKRMNGKIWIDSQIKFGMAFDGLDTITENYIRNMRANGEQINKNPRTIMSTIHGAKGGEADNVLLMQERTNAAPETFSHDPDELHRLFYTGATRAKRELHVLDPKNFDRAYIL